MIDGNEFVVPFANVIELDGVHGIRCPRLSKTKSASVGKGVRHGKSILLPKIVAQGVTSCGRTSVNMGSRRPTAQGRLPTPPPTAPVEVLVSALFPSEPVIGPAPLEGFVRARNLKIPRSSYLSGRSLAAKNSSARERRMLENTTQESLPPRKPIRKKLLSQARRGMRCYPQIQKPI